jgi:hypothetical protein
MMWYNLHLSTRAEGEVAGLPHVMAEVGIPTVEGDLVFLLVIT